MLWFYIVFIYFMVLFNSFCPTASPDFMKFIVTACLWKQDMEVVLELKQDTFHIKKKVEKKYHFQKAPPKVGWIVSSLLS